MSFVFPVVVLLLAFVLVSSIGWALLLIRLVTGFERSTKVSKISYKTGIEVTAIVPMRNEINNINQCITSLLADTVISKIIVVDDNSDDGSQNVVKRYVNNRKVDLISVSEREGWSGKSNACYNGAMRSNTDWLLFVDADTFVSSGIVSSLLSLAAERKLDAITCFGGLRCRGIWDRIAVPFYFALLNSFIKFGGNKEGRGSYFMGSFILIKRSEYFKIGGHKAVAGELVEDKALSDIAAKSRLKIEMAYAPKILSTEWAPGFKNGTQALSRVMLPPMRRNPFAGVWFAVLLTLLFALPWASILISLGTWFQLEFLVPGVLSVGFGISISAYAGRTMQLKKYYLYSFVFVLSEIIFLASLWINAFRAYTKPAITWRGRLYELDDLKKPIVKGKEQLKDRNTSENYQTSI